MQFISGASFWIPDSSAPSEWLEHAPFAFWIFEVLRPRVVVDVGSTDGAALSTFKQAAQAMCLGTKLHSVSGTLEDGTAELGDHSIDLLHIDCLGTPRETYPAWQKKLSSASVVLFYGVNHHSALPVIADSHRNFVFPHGLGMAVVAAGTGLPLEIQDLLEARANQSSKERIQAAYERLGRSFKVSLSPDSRERESAVYGDDLVSGLNNRIREAEAKIRDLENQLKILDAQETHKREMILDVLSSRVGQIRAEIEQPYVAEIERLKGVVAATSMDLNFYKTEYLKAVRSRSWKLTSPLRGEGTLFDLFRSSTAAK